MTTIINRTMQGARTPEGKVVSILLALSLSFMTWNAAAIESAYAYEGQDPAQAETVVEKPAGSEPASGDPSPEGNAAIRMMAENEGLFLDPVYTGKAFGGLIKMAREGKFGPDDNILYLYSGGAGGLFAIDVNLD